MSDLGSLVVAIGCGWTYLSRHRTPVCRFRSSPSQKSVRLRPGEAGWTTASLPELGDIELVPSRLSNFENGPTSGVDDLGCEVDGLSPQGCGIGDHRDHRLRDVFLETLIEEEGQEHDRTP